MYVSESIDERVYGLLVYRDETETAVFLCGLREGEDSENFPSRCKKMQARFPPIFVYCCCFDILWGKFSASADTVMYRYYCTWVKTTK